MSARDDYPLLASYEQRSIVVAERIALTAALDEIDNLRADVSKFLSMMAASGVEWDRK